MKKIKFIQINKENEKQFQQLISLWIPYLREIDSHLEVPKNESDEEIIKSARQRVNIQGNREDMHFELCCEGDELIGFGFFAVDLGGIKGIIDPGYGYIMEIYISPEKRLKGYGRLLFEHIENVFKGHNVKYMYLTPDLVSGLFFWKSMGFEDSGKIDPDNKLPLYIKKLK